MRSLTMNAGDVADADVSAEAAIASDKLAGTQRLLWSALSTESPGAFIGYRCLCCAHRNMTIRAFEVAQWAVPGKGNTATYNLLRCEDGILYGCLSAKIDLTSGHHAKQLYPGAIATAGVLPGESLWLRVEVAGEGPFGTGPVAVLTVDEDPLRGGIRTRFGKPV